MSRRTSLPGAAELFRTTAAPLTAEPAEPAASEPAQVDTAHPTAAQPGAVLAEPRQLNSVSAIDIEAETLAEPAPVVRDVEPAAFAAAPRRPAAAPAARATAVRNTRRIRAVADRAPSGRERHEEKITVYCSPEELLDLESARLHLRAEHGLAVDRGRIVREALAVVLADLEAKGESSILVRRLREA
ncbi:hypothetical protein SAMN05892883_3021 [Jatrophihabitans sp. GAS493]|uniref:hypothetical protein n=1 Tax=Jatrophihabitans sp. GAS493 TaxID=1907575 RepID=UPI000BB7409B|nr:hypothetical protein [Jatrophihabitans sp. GAS493]SOD73802.1 hypothetical protein SAMN05892883_3021 [Jatrophihabitans sp. GAS493]